MTRTSHSLLLLVITLYHGYSVTSSNVNAFEGFNVTVMDADIENLVVHVFSKDNDLGNKTMTVKTKFDWKFREAVGDSTVFKGEFFWKNADNIVVNSLFFNVFDKKVAAQCGQNIFVERKCFCPIAPNYTLTPHVMVPLNEEKVRRNMGKGKRTHSPTDSSTSQSPHSEDTPQFLAPKSHLEKGELAMKQSPATYVAEENTLNDKSSSDVALILIPENSFEVLKILENSLEELKVLENNLESMKLQEN
ncbi:plant self-incompatibility protein S1 family protein [Tanacetum coccineum]